MTLVDMFPDEASAAAWFESVSWPNGRNCPRCGSSETIIASATSALPYYCQGCHKQFSVRIGSALERSKVPFRKWVFAIFLEVTSLKGVSSMKLHRDIKVTQKTAWFMLQRIRRAWESVDVALMGPVKVDETHIGRLCKNRPKSRRKQLDGRGTVGKTVVVGVKDRGIKKVRAEVAASTDSSTLRGFVRNDTERGAMIYADEEGAYAELAHDYGHEAVNHGVGEYVRGMALTNGIESFWSKIKHAHDGVHRKINAEHLDRYVREFTGRLNVREPATIAQMGATIVGMIGQRLLYQGLIADNGLDSGARS